MAPKRASRAGCSVLLNGVLPASLRTRADKGMVRPETEPHGSVMTEPAAQPPGLATWLLVGTIFGAILFALYAPLVYDLAQRGSI